MPRPMATCFRDVPASGAGNGSVAAEGLEWFLVRSVGGLTYKLASGLGLDHRLARQASASPLQPSGRAG